MKIKNFFLNFLGYYTKWKMVSFHIFIILPKDGGVKNAFLGIWNFILKSHDEYPFISNSKIICMKLKIPIPTRLIEIYFLGSLLIIFFNLNLSLVIV